MQLLHPLILQQTLSPEIRVFCIFLSFATELGKISRASRQVINVFAEEGPLGSTIIKRFHDQDPFRPLILSQDNDTTIPFVPSLHYNVQSPGLPYK